MWWMGARPEHYTVSNFEPTQHDETKEIQMEKIPKIIQKDKKPQDKDPPLDVSAATLGKFPGETTLGPCTITSSELSEWKLVTKKFPGAATIPRESGGHKGTQQLNFGTLKLPALNKATCYSLEKNGLTKTSGNTWLKTNGEKNNEQ